MTSAPECIERFEKEGIFPASPALTARRLREKAPGLWPASIKGGGKNSPQVQPHHLTNFILAQAAHLPTDAAEAVAALRGLAWGGVDVVQDPRPPDTSLPPPVPPPLLIPVAQGREPLGPTLDELIDQAADPERRAQAYAIIRQLDWTLLCCVDPPFATVRYRLDQYIFTERFGDRPSGERARRLVELPYKVFVIAGELWEDSKARSAAPGRTALPLGQSLSATRAEAPPSTAWSIMRVCGCLQHYRKETLHGPPATAPPARATAR